MGIWIHARKSIIITNKVGLKDGDVDLWPRMGQIDIDEAPNRNNGNENLDVMHAHNNKRNSEKGKSDQRRWKRKACVVGNTSVNSMNIGRKKILLDEEEEHVEVDV